MERFNLKQKPTQLPRLYEPQHEVSNNVVCVTSQGSDQPAQSDQSPEYSMTLRLLTEHHLEFLSLKGGCTGPSESTLVKMPHYWKSHVPANMGLIKRNLSLWFASWYYSNSNLRIQSS